MKLFLDHNLSPKHAQVLHILLEPEGHHVEHLTARFDPASKDVDWIEELASEGGWSVLTLDRRINQKPKERSRWLNRPIVMYFLAPGWSKIQLLEKHRQLVGVAQKLVPHTEKAKPGTGWRISVRGVISPI